MGLMDVLRAAVVPATAARAGYVTGEREANDDEEKSQERKTALARQSRIDQMQENLRASEEEKNRAEAKWYQNRPAEPTTAPHTLDTDGGIVQWDPTTKTYKPTGFKKRPPASEDPARIAAKDRREKRIEQSEQLGGVNKQIDDTQQDLGATGRDYTLPSGERKSRIEQLRTRLDSLKGVSDSLNTVIKGGKPGPMKKAISSDQRDFLKTSKGMTDEQINQKYVVVP